MAGGEASDARHVEGCVTGNGDEEVEEGGGDEVADVEEVAGVEEEADVAGDEDDHDDDP